MLYKINPLQNLVCGDFNVSAVWAPELLSWTRLYVGFSLEARGIPRNFATIYSFFEGHNHPLYFFSNTFFSSSLFWNISNPPIIDQTHELKKWTKKISDTTSFSLHVISKSGEPPSKNGPPLSHQAPPPPHPSKNSSIQTSLPQNCWNGGIETMTFKIVVAELSVWDVSRGPSYAFGKNVKPIMSAWYLRRTYRYFLNTASFCSYNYW